MNLKRVTLKDVSSRCGYSANTVSRALRDDERLPESARKQIVRVAHEMLCAQLLRKHAAAGQQPYVAVVINDINNPHYTNIVSGIARCMSENQYKLVILSCRDDEAVAYHMLEMAISHYVDGILFFPYNNKAHIRLLELSHIPFVMLDRWISDVEVNVVRMDDEAGGAAYPVMGETARGAENHGL